MEEKKGSTKSRQEVLAEAAAKTTSSSEWAELHKEVMANHNADGWLRLCEILNEAKEDKRIISSPGASEFLVLMKELAADAFTASSGDEALQPLVEAIKSFRNKKIAIQQWKPNRVAKEWVISEWMKYKSDYEGNKAAFIRDYTKRVKNERGVPVTEKSMREYWLKGL